MSNAIELLKRAYELLDRRGQVENFDKRQQLLFEIHTFLAAEPEAEPIGFEFTIPGKELLRYHNDEDCIEIKVDLPRYPAGSRFYPPRPEPEAEPNCTRSHPHEGMSKECELRAEIAKLRNELANTKPEPEAVDRNAIIDECILAVSLGICRDGHSTSHYNQSTRHLDALKAMKEKPAGAVYQENEIAPPVHINLSCKSVQHRLATQWGYVKREAEAEPVAWPVDREWLRTVLRFAEKNPDYFYDVEPGFISLDSGDTDTIIAALNKSAEPARKPMTERKIMEQAKVIGLDDVATVDFAFGVRWAEKHHGIGANLSDPDSIDLQSQCRGDKL